MNPLIHVNTKAINCVHITSYSHQGNLPPFGLKLSQVKRVTGDKEFNQDHLEKVCIIKLYDSIHMYNFHNFFS